MAAKYAVNTQFIRTADKEALLLNRACPRQPSDIHCFIACKTSSLSVRMCVSVCVCVRASVRLRLRESDCLQ